MSETLPMAGLYGGGRVDGMLFEAGVFRCYVEAPAMRSSWTSAEPFC